MRNIAIITGASSGLGLEMCKIIDRDEDFSEIWLIARRRARLEDLAKELSRSVKILALDLTDSNFCSEFIKELDPEIRIGLLINSAGLGFDGPFKEMKGREVREMIDLNVGALTDMTHLCLPYMDRGSRIINIASVAAFLPQPDFAVYAASKAYVLSLSRALNAELKSRGISVLAVCPNPMRTEFFEKASKSGGIKWFKALGAESPKKVAEKAMRRSGKKRDISLSHPASYFIRFASKILPHSWILKIEKWIGLY